MINLDNVSIKLIIENFLVSLPYTGVFFATALIFCGYKESLNLKTLFKVTIIQSILDVLFTISLSKYGLQMIPSLIFCIILIVIFFKIDFLSAIISSAISNLFSILSQFLYLSTISYVLGINFSEFVKLIDISNTNNSFVAFLTQYSYFSLYGLLLLFMYKKNIYFLNLKKYKVFNNASSKIFDNMTLIAIIITPMTFFILINYSIDYYNIFNNVKYSFPVYLTINSLVIIFSSILMFVLVNKIIKLKYYKASWETQQKYIGDINELLKGLRAQKHGFLNHMNILHGLITLGEYDNAKKYLESINDAISFKNNPVSINNPTLSALLNVKAKLAENKNVRFEVDVNDSLSGMNFKIFELEEAIGNIIDNAIEATCELDKKNRYIKINIYSDNNNYIFDIQNKGKTIHESIINKIFEEGYTTKLHEKDDHGLGLYIAKKIIDCHNGLIKVDSKNKYTSFKIYLPKVVSREFKAG